MTGSLTSDVDALAQASVWLRRLQSDTLGSADGLAFEAWLRAAPHNAAAYREVLAAWHAWQAMDSLGRRAS